MGIYECPTHGRQGLAFHSPALSRAFDAKERLASSRIARLRYTTMNPDEYPPLSAWVLVEEASGIGDRLASDEEAMSRATEIECSACFTEWLRSNGVDTAYSAAEQRFVEVSDALNDLLRPRLEPHIKAISDALFRRRTEPTGWGFMELRGRPFRAYFSQRTNVFFLVQVSAEGDALTATAESTLATFSVPAELATPWKATLVNGALDEACRATLLRWCVVVERVLEDGLKQL